jgi:hypothetical protein
MPEASHLHIHCRENLKSLDVAWAGHSGSAVCGVGFDRLDAETVGSNPV